jgi:formylaminopyrimidine deformylase / aminopyrimidine aminohydrolase
MNVEHFEQSRLVKGAGELWREGTQAQFLDAVRDGSLPEEAFNRWLVQDYLFVRGFTGFTCILAAKLGRPAQRTLINGLGALNDELDWFERHAQQRGLDLDIEPHPTCRRYVDHLLAAVYTRPVRVLLAVMYGVEVSYCVGWGRLRGSAAQYAEFIDRWSNEGFLDYVRQLEQLTDEAEHPDQQRAFNDVLRYEREFWRMTWGD